MYRVILTFFLSINLLYCCSQVTELNGQPSAFLIGSQASIYQNSVCRKMSFSIENPNDNFYHLLLIKKIGRRVYTKIINLSITDSDYYYGWVDFSNIGITFNSDTIELFSNYQRKFQCKKVFILKGTTIANVLSYRKNGWLKVTFNSDNTSYIGWVPPKYQCSNLFTMCCGD